MYFCALVLFTMIGVLIITVILILYLYHLSTKNLDYWEKRNIPNIKPLPLIGNYGQYIFLKEYIGKANQALCRQYPFAPYIGAFFGKNPTLIVQDPELLKQIMTKDFYYFSSRENSAFINNEIFLGSLFFVAGDMWKILRQHMTPIFSSSKIKVMFDDVKKSAYLLEKVLHEEKHKDNVDVKSVLVRYTLNVTGDCIFGIDARSFEKDWRSNSLVRLTHLFSQNTKIRGWKQIGRAAYPNFFYRLGLKNFSTSIDHYFKNYLKDLYTESSSVKQCGFTDFLRKINKNNILIGDSIENVKGSNTKAKLSVDDHLVLGQCMTIFSGAFDSAATIVSYALYELAKKPELQERALEEVDEHLRRHSNKLEYECLTDLPFINACLEETMRLYPIVGILRREVTHSYTLPCGAVLDKGVRVHIPIYHMHHNPRFFPNPEEFRPDRFLGENRKDISPYTYLAFGEGPRMCIGMRFAKMQMVPAMIAVLKRYRVKLPADMPRQLEFIPASVIPQPVKKITLDFMERDGWQQRMFAT